MIFGVTFKLVYRFKQNHCCRGRQPQGVLAFDRPAGSTTRDSQLSHCERMTLARHKQLEVKLALEKYDGSRWSRSTTVAVDPNLGLTDICRIGRIKALDTPIVYEPGSLIQH